MAARPKALTHDRARLLVDALRTIGAHRGKKPIEKASIAEALDMKAGALTATLRTAGARELVTKVGDGYRVTVVGRRAVESWERLFG